MLPGAIKFEIVLRCCINVCVEFCDAIFCSLVGRKKLPKTFRPERSFKKSTPDPKDLDWALRLSPVSVLADSDSDSVDASSDSVNPASDSG
jgi:hypothetical protein